MDFKSRERCQPGLNSREPSTRTCFARCFSFSSSAKAVAKSSSVRKIPTSSCMTFCRSHSRRFFMSSPSIAPGRQVTLPSRAVPLSWVLLLALLVHGPLSLMQITNDSYDADFHKFFAAHYATHWFNPWNEKWFTGFSQTTYPPMEQQWMALFSHVMGLNLAYIFVQLIAILLLAAGVFRFARIWVN